MVSSFVTLFFVVACFAHVSGNKVKEELSRSLLGHHEIKGLDICGTGKSQSPVNIISQETKVNNTLEPLLRDCKLNNATLITDGEHVQVTFEAEGGIVIDGKAYNLKQMHWHTPSEHRLNGVQYAAELHEVHIADDGSKTVVGILYEEGPPSKILTKLKPDIEELVKTSCKEPEAKFPVMARFDTSFNKKTHGKYYRYMGSLTTPPCLEPVLWNVLLKVKTISKEQIELVDAAVCKPDKNNARDAQPLNGRVVQKFDGRDEYDG